MRQISQGLVRAGEAGPLWQVAKRLIPGLAAMWLLAGCAHRYDVTLTNSMRVTNVSRPVLDRASGVYIYKDSRGEERRIMASRVVSIDPHSRRIDSTQFGQP